MLTVGLSELRSNLATVTQRVVEDGEEVLVIKHNRPAFKLVPLGLSEKVKSDSDEVLLVKDQSETTDKQKWMQLFSKIIDEYPTVFERLAE